MASSSPQGTALITGASSGIGALYADRLARRGYNLILVARDQQRLAALAARLSAETGANVDVLAADLTARPDLLRVEQRLREDTHISMLVNNAGMAVNGQLIACDIDAVQTMIKLNVIAPTRLAAAAAAGFVARRRGTLVNIASVLALAPELFNGSYSGTKAYVLNLSHSLQQELGPHGIRVQAVLPGATRTELWDRSGSSIDQLPASMLMEVDAMVDAALAGLDAGEAVTIPSMEPSGKWEAFEQARLALGPHLSLSQPASRYRQQPAGAH